VAGGRRLPLQEPGRRAAPFASAAQTPAVPPNPARLTQPAMPGDNRLAGRNAKQVQEWRTLRRQPQRQTTFYSCCTARFTFADAFGYFVSTCPSDAQAVSRSPSAASD